MKNGKIIENFLVAGLCFGTIGFFSLATLILHQGHFVHFEVSAYWFIWPGIVCITLTLACMVIAGIKLFNPGYIVFEVLHLADGVIVKLESNHYAHISGEEFNNNKPFEEKKGDFYYHAVYKRKNQKFHGMLHLDFQVNREKTNFFEKLSTGELKPVPEPLGW